MKDHVSYQELRARSLVFHEYIIKCAVEYCVNEVSHTEIEDEQVGYGPHLSVLYN